MKALAFLIFTAASSAMDSLEWKAFPDVPDAEGFAGMYAGVSNGVLLAAGGANFPDKKPWEGGQKIWYDTVWILNKPDGAWRKVGALPSPRGYGVSINTDEGLLCIGGAEAEAHVNECLLLTWKDGTLQTSKLPALPKKCANFCGARVGDVVYVAGGIETPLSTVALKTFWSLNLREPDAGWKELAPWPGAERMLATAAVHEGAFYLMSGTALHAGEDGKPARTYLKDAWKYAPERGWEKLADLPRATVAAPSSAPVVNGRIWVLGGDDGELVNFEPKTKHPGFPMTALQFDIAANKWSDGGAMKASLVTNSVTLWQEWHVMVSGEQRPGVRSPAVWGVR